jgi:hypothetical protein
VTVPKTKLPTFKMSKIIDNVDFVLPHRGGTPKGLGTQHTW